MPASRRASGRVAHSKLARSLHVWIVLSLAGSTLVRDAPAVSPSAPSRTAFSLRVLRSVHALGVSAASRMQVTY